jgi:hypothetical protein
MGKTEHRSSYRIFMPNVSQKFPVIQMLSATGKRAHGRKPYQLFIQ